MERGADTSCSVLETLRVNLFLHVLNCGNFRVEKVSQEEIPTAVSYVVAVCISTVTREEKYDQYFVSF